MSVDALLQGENLLAMPLRSGAFGSFAWVIMVVIFKICPRQLWEEANRKGIFSGAAIDITDGFIHFSTADQVRETARRHFSGQQNLIIAAFDSEAFGPRLRWEPSRGGDLFPHLYEPLSVAAAIAVTNLPLGSDGQHVFPEGAPFSGILP